MLLSGPLATRAAVLGMTQEPVRKAGQKVARSLSSATMTPLSHRLHCWIPRFGSCFSPWLVLFFLIVSLSCVSGLRAGIYLQPGFSASEAVYHQPLLYKYWTIDFFFLFVNLPQRCFIVWGKQQQKEKCHRTGKTEEHTADTRSLASQMS